MARIHFTSGESNTNVSKPVKRMRWATTRKPGQSGSKKRLSILQRVPKVHVSAYEEKPAGPKNDGSITDESPMGEQQPHEESSGRKVYFNQPLPPDARNEDGHIIAKYSRNKIRTAKYTPLSFVPKNLWFQFHNVANIYFLFIAILSVSWSLTPYKQTFLTCPDLLHLWRFEPGLVGCSSDLHSDRYCHQRRRRRLAPDGAGCRTQQFSGL
jgi:hypothetical protein